MSLIIFLLSDVFHKEIERERFIVKRVGETEREQHSNVRKCVFTTNTIIDIKKILKNIKNVTNR